MGVKVFISYLLRDLDAFQIEKLAEVLTGKPEIEEVMYWHKDATGNMIQFMNDSVEKCHIMLLFCSKKSEESEAQKKEWSAAGYLNKVIIPIFHKVEHIPSLIGPNRGVEFDFLDFEETLNQIYKLVRENLPKEIVEEFPGKAEPVDDRIHGIIKQIVDDPFIISNWLWRPGFGKKYIENLIKEIESVDPSNNRAIALAHLYLEINDSKSAENYIDYILTRDPDSFEGRLLKSEVLKGSSTI